MATNNIYIQVDLNSQTAQQNVNALNTAIAKTGPTAQKSATQSTAALQSVSVQVQQTTRAFGELTAALAGLGIGRLAAAIVQVGSELGRAQTMMEAFTGSAEAAAKVFADIRSIALQGVFPLKDLEQAAQAMVGFGMSAKDVPAAIKIISDQVTAMGGSIENVNSIVRLFGRVMDKEFVAAMDLMRLLPQQGVKVGEALKKGLGVDEMQEATKLLKEGALDSEKTIQTILRSMQQQTGGAGERVNDAAKALKNFGIAVDSVSKELIGPHGFGPALDALGRSIQGLLAPLAGLIVELNRLPDSTKETIVTIAAATAAVVALSTAVALISPAIGPALGAIKLLGVALITVFENPALLAAIAAIGGSIFALYQFKPELAHEWQSKLTNMVLGAWETIKGKLGSLAKEGQDFFGKLFTPAAIADPGSLLKETKANFDAVQKQVAEWSDAAGKIMLQALSSPAEAVAVKYHDLFNKLSDLLKEKAITPEHAATFRGQLAAAQEMETESKLFEKRKQDIAEQAKLDIERVKGSYEAQIAYIEALDAQDLRGKVAAIDRITELRIQSAETVSKVEQDQQQQIFNEQKQRLEQYRDVFEKAGVNVDQAIADRQGEMVAKQKVIAQTATDEEQKYRLEGWKRANDAIIEDQKRVYESFKSEFDEIFDAFTQRTKSIGQALADVFKKLALGEARNIFSSQAAAFATEAAGYGRPEEGRIGRGGGILSTLLQRGMPPRPPGPPPDQYKPGRAESELKTDLSGSATHFAISVSAYDQATDRFTLAVGQFAEAAVVHRVSAERINDASSSIEQAGTAIGQASTAASGESSAQGATRAMLRAVAPRSISASGSSITGAINEAAAATGVDPALLGAVAKVESGLRPGAVSNKGAMGLMQLMPGTAKDLGVTKPFDPDQNLKAGATYLQQLTKRYGGDINKALAAYNMGPAAFDRAQASGRPLPAETQDYVERVTSTLSAYTGRPAPREFQLPPGFSTAGGQLTYSPPQAPSVAPPLLESPPDIDFGPTAGGVGSVGSVTAGVMPAALSSAKQPGLLGKVAGVGLGALGLGQSTGGAAGAGGAGTQQAGLGKLLGGGLGGLKGTFGIGGTSSGGTSLNTVLTSSGVASLAGIAGGALIGTGLNKRNAPLTVAGGALTGVKLGQQLGLGWAQGPLAGAGIGLFMAGVQRGGGAGVAMDIGGGALTGAMLGLKYGGPVGALIGAGVGAAVGLVTGLVRLKVQTEAERIRSQIKQVYGVDISNLQVLQQIKQIVDQKYGGSVSVGIRSQDVQDLVRLYALSTGQSALNMPRPMYAATIAQSAAGGSQLQQVYQGGAPAANPYTGPTTYQYQTAVTAAQGLMAGKSTGVPGASGIINSQWQQLSLQTIQGNPAAIAMASAAAFSAGDSRLTTAQAMQEPLTALS